MIVKATDRVHTGPEMTRQHEDQSGRAGAKHRKRDDRRDGLHREGRAAIDMPDTINDIAT